MSLKLLRIDVVSIFDLRFDGADRIPWQLVSADDPHSRLASRLTESFSWVFYGDDIDGFRLYDLTSAVPGCAGAALRVNPQSRVGAFMIWRAHDGNADPHKLKSSAWDESGYDSAILDTVFRNLRVDRIYPFLAIQLDTDPDQLDAAVQARAEELGRLLTGGLEGERPATLKQYIEADLSRRSYEKLFLRWTEALAVYSRLDKDLYERCMFRAAQLFEHCILAQVSLVSIIEHMDRFSRRLMVVTPSNWFRSRELFTALATTETTFIIYPRTQSVEANRLLAAAQDQFGLAAFLSSAKSKGAEVREQFEWAKTQTLALIAVLTYLLDKIIGWDHVKHWVAALFLHHG
jgi:hypothetical protein